MAIFEVKEDSIQHVVNLNIGGILFLKLLFYAYFLGCLSSAEKILPSERNFLITGIFPCPSFILIHLLLFIFCRYRRRQSFNLGRE